MSEPRLLLTTCGLRGAGKTTLAKDRYIVFG